MVNNGKGANMKNDNDVENTEDAEVVCPYCGSRNIAHLIYGMPAFTEELQRKLDEGKVALGGCVLEYDRPMPYYHCNDCGEEF